MDLRRLLTNVTRNADTLRDAARIKNLRVLLSLLGPAVRGFVLQRGKAADSLPVPLAHDAHFTWTYERDQPEMARLYAAAKQGQWDGARDLPWQTPVDPLDEERDLIPDAALPLREIPQYRALPRREQAAHRHAFVAWMLSQFLHGEQGALYAACQVTQAVTWTDGKFYGSTQVVDEGRHVEVFHRYLHEKIGRLYQINDNLYVVIESLMRDDRWDFKFLGMQIMIEGLALGAFGALRAVSREPLLREMLKYVIADEARHVHYGVIALRDHFGRNLAPAELREREDWTYEVSLLLRNRFLAHEFYDEYYGHCLSRDAWNRLVVDSDFMRLFRSSMFRRIIPNLKRIHLLSDRIRPHYAALGLLEWENGKAAPELTARDLLDVA